MKKGFTLVEVLAVIAILAVIALITVPTITGVIEKSNMDTFTRSVEEMRNVISMDYNEYGRYGEVNYKYENNTLVCVGCNEGKDLELRRKNAIEYQELYTLWQKIAEAKQNNDLNLNSYYDDLVYRLYLKGYRSE